MNIHPNFFWTGRVRKLMLIPLLTVFLSGSLALAQDSISSTGLKIDPEYLVLVTTLGNLLKVRQQPTVSSTVVGRVANESKLPLVTTENATNGKEAWFQVEYAQGKFGWVSGDYSKKIRTAKKTEPSKVAQQDSNIEPPAQDEKPVVTNTKTQKSSALPSAPVTESVTESVTEPAQKKKVKTKKPWAKIDGFRSAKFGMKMQEVREAIYQDFNIQGKKISIINHPTQHTKNLAITVNNLLPNSGDSRVVYGFGYQSKKLAHVNILTGFPVDRNISAQQVVNSGNFLGKIFFKKRYQKDGFVVNAKLNDGSAVIFRGKDQKGRMVFLRLSNPQPNKNDKDIKITLNLSYIEKPGQPDTYQLKENDF